MEKETRSLIPKISIILNIALMALVAYLLTRPAQTETPAAKNEIPTPPSKEEPAPICKDYSQEPLDGISYETAKDMFINYKTHYDKIGYLDNKEIIDAQSVWFDLETLKKFFYKIEDTLLKQNVTVPDLKLGIRIYYAAYPKKEDMAADPALSGLPPEYELHHTVFMVPTFTDKKDPQIKYDFNPWYPDLDTQNQPTAVPDILRRREDDPALTTGFILSIGSSLYMQNHGQVGPPPQVAVPGTTFFRQLGQ